MRKFVKNTAFAIAVGAAAIGFGSAAIAADYKVDPTHSFVQFKIKHLGFSWMVGQFNDMSGDMTYDPANPDAQSIAVEIATDSVDTNHAERDKHLRSPDFLNVEKYPTATFKSTGFSGDENGGTLTGDLTVHGVTKPIDIAVKKIGEGKDPWGGYRAGFEGTTTLVRKDFGMDYNLGPASESMEMLLYIEGIKK